MWHLSTTVVGPMGGTTTRGYQSDEAMLAEWERAINDPDTLYAHFTRDAKVIEQFVRKAPTAVELSRATG